MPATGTKPSLNEQIASRVRQLRAARAMSLEALADRSGVSRSMISLIERGESSPTAVVLEKLAAGLNVSLASLFDEPQPDPKPVARRAEQRQWRDPASGYVRRNVSPSGFASPIEIVEVEFPPGARVAFESAARDVRVHQQVWVLDGSIDLKVGDEAYRLDAGDCLAFVLDRPTAFRNPTRKAARYAVVIVSQTGHQR
jgi:transcriptional regulator with XRE-family HTH domain